MNKTVVVEVERTIIHPKYKKRLKRTKRYHVQDENNSSKVGTRVLFVETKPISKTKSWKVLEAVK